VIAKFTIHPARLADVLANAIDFSPGKGAQSLGVRITAQLGEEGGEVAAVGVSERWAASDWSPVEGYSGADSVAVVVDHLPDKGDVVDSLSKLVQALGTGATGERMTGVKVSSAVGTRVFVEIEHRRRLTVTYGGSLLGELPDLGIPESKERVFEWVEDALDVTPGTPLQEPRAFLIPTLGHLGKVRGVNGEQGAGKALPKERVDVVDLAAHPTIEGMTLARVGATFNALLGGVDRSLFAAGGPWSSGPGRESCLLGAQPGRTRDKQS